MFKVLLFVLGLSALNSTVQANCSTSYNGWNWQGATYMVYDNVNKEASILSPFSAGAAYGVDVSGQHMCFEDGWRIYSRKLTCEDFGADCSVLAATSSDYRPSVIFYNIHTGQLRFFVYTRDFERNDEELLIKVQVNHGGIESESNLGLLLNDSKPITILNEKESDYAKTDWIVLPSYKNKWVVFDKYLSYDPAAEIDSNTRISVLFARRDTSNIYLTGDLTVETSYTLDREVASNKNVGVSDLYDVYKSYGSPGLWASDLESQGGKLLKSGEESGSDIKSSAGKTLLNMASFVSSNSGVFGYANAAYSAYSVFSGAITPSSSSYQTMYSSGTLSIDGTITDESPIEFLQYGVATSNQDQDVDEPKLSEVGYSGKLGLISISDRPKIIIKSVVYPYDYDFFPGNGSNRYKEIDCPDKLGGECTFWFDVFQYSLLDTKKIKELIVVNPDSNMIVKKVAIQPVLMVEQGYWSSYNSYARGQGFYSPSYVSIVNLSAKNSLVDCIENGYDFSRCFNLSSEVLSESTRRWDESGVIGEISPKSMYDVNSKFLASPNGESSKEYLGDSSGNMSGIFTQRFTMGGRNVHIRHGYQWRDVLLNVYVELEHKMNSDIKTEMKLRIPVEIGLCDGFEVLSDALHLTKHEVDKFFTPTDAQCKSMDHTIKNPIRADQYSELNKNPILANDVNADRYCLEEFGTHANSYESICADDEISYSTYRSSGWSRGESRNSCRTSFIDSVSCN